MSWIELIRYEGKRPSERAMQRAEGMIIEISQKYVIPGFDQEDVAQELRLHLWRKMNKYNPERAAFSTWAYCILCNRAIDLTRKKDHFNNRIDIDLYE